MNASFFVPFTEAVDARLHTLLKQCAEPTLREACAYSVFAGGKRLRPLLLLAVCESLCGAYDQDTLTFACAIEMIHTYSLIHDDLPAMDDDDLRRGHPTCHKVYGEATAILAGDALLSYAFEQMAFICAETGRKRHQTAMYRIARAAGINGMVAGQQADMEAEHKSIDERALLSIHARKTGALITACFEAGALLGGASDARVRRLARLGQLTGTAFQIRDDILDVTGTAETLGKPTHSDEKNHKNTYVTVHGLEKARTDYRRISNEALTLLDAIPQKTETLHALMDRIINRDA